MQADRPFEIRILESLNSLRMFKLIRYYEGAQILVKAVVAAAQQVTRCHHHHRLRLHHASLSPRLLPLSQLVVGLFLLLIMVYNFSSIIFELEWDESIHNCVEHWVRAARNSAQFGAIRRAIL